MKIDQAASTPFICDELGRRIAAARTAQGHSQAEMAKMIGIGRNRWSRLEQGDAKLSTFVAALSQLGLVAELDRVARDAQRSPLEGFKRSQSRRKKSVKPNLGSANRASHPQRGPQELDW